MALVCNVERVNLYRRRKNLQRELCQPQAKCPEQVALLHLARLSAEIERVNHLLDASKT